MKCERCKKTEASIHLSEIIKDDRSDVHLCESCARDIGLHTKISDFNLSLPEMLTFIDAGELDESVNPDRCQTCGTTFLDYKVSGKCGCADCYFELYNSLYPSISNYHGSVKHCGKTPLNFNQQTHTQKMIKDEKPVITEESSSLQEQLENAIDDERYEDAAILRDRIEKSKEKIT